jgi:SAM-dependent methyltransferase
MKSIYVCPKTKKTLTKSDNGKCLMTEDGLEYPLIGFDSKVPNFLSANTLDESNKINLEIYNNSFSAERYSNELKWLYATFGETEESFRAKIIENLEIKQGQKILITGCGLGSDIRYIAERVGVKGAVYAQDLAPEMVLASDRHLQTLPFDTKNIYLSISNAQNLPFLDDFFDGVFHFGGINLFENIKQSIDEMARVTKPGGRIVFGDEGVAPWLREVDYGRAAICNNSLWSAHPPIHLLPNNSTNVNLSWVLGNCFYLISFNVTTSGPYMNMDIEHKGLRGGTMRTRYFGRIDGVSSSSKELITEGAKNEGISIFQWVEKAIQERSRKLK